MPGGMARPLLFFRRTERRMPPDGRCKNASRISGIARRSCVYRLSLLLGLVLLEHTGFGELFGQVLHGAQRRKEALRREDELCVFHALRLGVLLALQHEGIEADVAVDEMDLAHAFDEGDGLHTYSCDL